MVKSKSKRKNKNNSKKNRKKKSKRTNKKVKQKWYHSSHSSKFNMLLSKYIYSDGLDMLPLMVFLLVQN